MRVYYSQEVIKFIESIGDKDRARIKRTREFFERYGFQIGPKYIKKITRSGIWELGAGKIRIFLFIEKGSAMAVNVIYKKSQKLALGDIKLAEKRSKLLK